MCLAGLHEETIYVSWGIYRHVPLQPLQHYMRTVQVETLPMGSYRFFTAMRLWDA